MGDWTREDVLLNPTAALATLERLASKNSAYKTIIDGATIDNHQKQAEIERLKASKWTSVVDHMPEDCTEVIFYDVSCGGEVGCGFFEDERFNDSVGEPVDGVTDWQPLPEPPKHTGGTR
jgi:hypothetical protein